jgi:hypothetical protein
MRIGNLIYFVLGIFLLMAIPKTLAAQDEARLQGCLKQRVNICRFVISGPGHEALLKNNQKNPLHILFKGRVVYTVHHYRIVNQANGRLILLARGSWKVNDRLRNSLLKRRGVIYQIMSHRHQLQGGFGDSAPKGQKAALM